MWTNVARYRFIQKGANKARYRKLVHTTSATLAPSLIRYVEAPTNGGHDSGTTRTQSSSKADAPSPQDSTELIEALGPIGSQYGRVQGYETKIDWSRVDPLLHAVNRKQAIRASDLSKSTQFHVSRAISPKKILVDYLKYVSPGLQELSMTNYSSTLLEALSLTFKDRTCVWLQDRNWDITDVTTWAWILSAERAERAAFRMEFIGRGKLGNIPKCLQIPQFLFVFLLKRQNMTARGLESLLKFAWRYMDSLTYTRPRLGDRPVKTLHIPHPMDDAVGMYDFIFMMIIIRLLRTARVVWPAACPNIAQLFCRYMDGINFKRRSSGAAASPTPITDTAGLAFMYNKILKLIGLPTSQNPAQYATYHEEAQFIVLRRMSHFNPPLTIDRQGYRAVTSVQLLHPKTEDEERWSALKSKSWPPWIKEQSGMDADLGFEDGISRAKDVLMKSKAAGYSTDWWEDAAQTLAGWDTDHSPTIQSRVALSPALQKGRLPTPMSDNVELWVARITATRTLEEAWSAFLSWKAESVRRTELVYQAMFKKLFLYRKSQTRHYRTVLDSDTVERHPGDTLAVYPNPSPPDSGVYLQTPVPTVQELWYELLKDDIKISESLLCLLVQNAENYSIAEEYMRAAQISSQQITALLYYPFNRDENAENYIVEGASAKLVSAVARLALSRWQARRHSNQEGQDVKSGPERYSATMKHGYDLMLVTKSRDRALWNRLISAYTSSRMLNAFAYMDQPKHYPIIIGWLHVSDMVEHMEEQDIGFDADGVRRLCHSLHRATLAVAGLTRKYRGLDGMPGNMRNTVDRALSSGFLMVEKIFWNTFRRTSILTGSERPRESNKRGSEENLSNQAEPSPASSSSEESGQVEKGKQAAESYSRNTPSAGCNNIINNDQEDSTQEEALPLSETPTLVDLHGYVSLLGLLRRNDEVLETVRWMTQHAESISKWSKHWKQRKIDRHCIVALRVYLERTWQKHNKKPIKVDWLGCENEEDYEQRLGPAAPVATAAAPRPLVEEIKQLILSKEHIWGGWPAQAEMHEYMERYKLVSVFRARRFRHPHRAGNSEDDRNDDDDDGGEGDGDGDSDGVGDDDGNSDSYGEDNSNSNVNSTNQ